MKRTICIAVLTALCLLPAKSQDLKLRTVVIDAGHGGKDPGAVSKDRKYYEKTFTLDIARRLRDRITDEYPDVKVVMTRDRDVFVELEERAQIANRAKADLFISIHINASKSTSANGFSVHLLGQSSNKNRDLFASNLEVCQRENSVIMLEDDYTAKYQGFDPTDPESFIFMQLMQNSNLEQSMDFANEVSRKLVSGPIRGDRGIWQQPLWVLWRTAMPAALLELGFISNTSDLEVLANEDKRNQIADCLCDAFGDYKKSYDSKASLSGNDDLVVKTTPVSLSQNNVKPTEKKTESVENQPIETPQLKERFGVQIFAGSRKLDSRDSQFMGYTPVILPSGSIFKYIIGVSESEEEARENLAQIKKRYPQAFLVRISSEIAVMVKP